MSITNVDMAHSTAPSLSGPEDPKLKKVCQQFEGQFFDMMLQEMRKTVPDDPTLGDDAHEQQIFQGMMDDNIAQDMAKHGGANDPADQLYQQLSRMEQSQKKSGSPVSIKLPTINPEPIIPIVKMPGNLTDDDNNESN